MPITAVIAIGLNSDSVENFFRMMLEIRNFVAKLPHEKRVPSYITDCKGGGLLQVTDAYNI